MRVIKQGQLPEEKLYTITCFNCKTQFEFARKEAQYQSDWRDGDFLRIDCPLCKNSCTTAVNSSHNYWKDR